MNNLYRPNVGIILLNAEKKIFVGKRVDLKEDEKNFWQMPQGGIDDNETPKDAVLREIEEELGVKNVLILDESKTWYVYDFPNDIAQKSWKGRYKGQRQKWFLLSLQNDEQTLNLQTEHPEFCDMRWVTPQEAIDLIVPFKKDVYQCVLKEFEKWF